MSATASRRKRTRSSSAEKLFEKYFSDNRVSHLGRYVNGLKDTDTYRNVMALLDKAERFYRSYIQRHKKEAGNTDAFTLRCLSLLTVVLGYNKLPDELLKYDTQSKANQKYMKDIASLLNKALSDMGIDIEITNENLSIVDVTDAIALAIITSMRNDKQFMKLVKDYPVVRPLLHQSPPIWPEEIARKLLSNYFYARNPKLIAEEVAKELKGLLPVEIRDIKTMLVKDGVRAVVVLRFAGVRLKYDQVVMPDFNELRRVSSAIAHDIVERLGLKHLGGTILFVRDGYPLAAVRGPVPMIAVIYPDRAKLFPVDRESLKQAIAESRMHLIWGNRTDELVDLLVAAGVKREDAEKIVRPVIYSADDLRIVKEIGYDEARGIARDFYLIMVQTQGRWECIGGGFSIEEALISSTRGKIDLDDILTALKIYERLKQEGLVSENDKLETAKKLVDKFLESKLNKIIRSPQLRLDFDVPAIVSFEGIEAFSLEPLPAIHSDAVKIERSKIKIKSILKDGTVVDGIPKTSKDNPIDTVAVCIGKECYEIGLGHPITVKKALARLLSPRKSKEIYLMRDESGGVIEIFLKKGGVVSISTNRME
ncbi:MAG: hypothetical protein GXO26_03245 [Crenarchaeota archaeon]|nr:hypothetical protein [Thermoproteota archaeon]